MITKKTIYPGQPGSGKWVKKYGKNLLCVQYKYDPVKNKKMIPVELVVKYDDWRKNKDRIPQNKSMAIRINYGEGDLGRKVKSF